MSDAEGGGRYDAIVLGAGISGLVSASVLLKQGCRRVLVADEYSHLGGNHIDWSSDGYTFDIGSLIFQDDSPLLAHFPELLPRYVPIDPHWARLNPQGMVTAYPISLRDDLLGSGPLQLAMILGSALYARLFHRRMANARDFARYWIGDRLLRRSGLEAYMRRFYGVEPEQIDLELARKRMLWISEHASIPNVLRRLLTPRRAGPTNRQLARPREGFQYLYSAAAEQLSQRGASFRLGARFQAITKDSGGFTLHCEDGEIAARRIVSTIPIPRAQELCGIAAAKLETVTLIALYFSFAGERGFDSSILYNFSHESAWKRLTVYSDFYGRTNGREYFAAEVIADHVGRDAAKAEADFRRHMAANSLLIGDLKLEGHQFLENAYPIYKNGAEQAAAEAVRSLKAFGVESFGRQGAFNYQPTARVSTVEAEAALQR